MKRQRNIPQMKELEKSPEKELNEMETSNLPILELKKMLIMMLRDLSENFNKETVSIKKDIETVKNSQK